MPPIQQTPAVRRRSVGRPRKAPPVIVQNKNEAAQYRYQAYQPSSTSPKSPRTINSRIQKSTSPQSPRAARAGTTRSGRRYSPATPPRQEFIFETQYGQSQPYNTALDHRRAQAQEAQVAAHAEAQRRALATQHQHQLDDARAQLQPQSEPRRRASAARRLSRARNIYTSDPLSRPILYNADTNGPTQILYHSDPNATLSALRSPDRSKFLHRQARIDDPHSPTNAWSGFGEDAELPARSYGAAVELAGKGYCGARVVGMGRGRGLRLLERRGTLDCLSGEERRELVAWWGAKYGGGGGSGSGEVVGAETSVASAGSSSSSRGRKGRSKKNVNAHVNAGWASQVWEYVRQRKWNRRKKETKGRPHFYDAQAEYDAAIFGSRESAESWRSDVAGAGGRGGRG
ncbi:hypothetical protein LTR70_003405 [Exophiala xenobiotica]|uniref:Uncharacterized protein n=1 Tax=Lithohypha guttulata TaxID=1690604 RepID=A0ABR0KIF8_9EURO|nr:hypothetical protein LTR24_002952 [Lithohypha guttulata]KAK5323543.1 hypothetical protein LTR70_003405 [Exophiala xenobiotica]